jgi:hypothetical protein
MQVSRALTCQLSSEVGHTNKVDNRLGYVQGLGSLKLAAGSYQVAACRVGLVIWYQFAAANRWELVATG